MPNPGDLINARYRIEEKISEGGSATVYRAVDSRSGGPVALKHQRLSTRDEPDFLREARLLVDLHNRVPSDLRPHLVRVTDFGVDPQQGQFIVMEYLPGADFAGLMAGATVPYTLDDLLQWTLDLLRLLEFLHGHNPPIIHGDIKPKNLKLRQNAIVLLDFGVAKPRTTPQQPILLFNNTLTPAYAALEVFEDQLPDPRSDLYALGATMYHLLSGYEPESAQTRKSYLDQGGADPLVPIAELNTYVQRPVSDVFSRAMQVQPDQRFPTAQAMRVALHQAMRQNSAAAPATAPATAPTAAPATTAPATTVKLPTSAPAAPASTSAPAASATTSKTAPAAVPDRWRSWLVLLGVLLVLLVLANIFGPRLSQLVNPSVGVPTSVPVSPSVELPTDSVPATVAPATAAPTDSVPPTAAPTNSVPPTTAPATAVPTALPQQTALPPGAIVFASNRGGGGFDLYAMDADGANQRLIYGGPGDDHAPALSPDRQRVAFISDQGGSNDLYVIEVGGTTPVQLTNDRNDDAGPSWSPDGQQIAFAAQRSPENDYEIMAVNADGSALTQITDNTTLDFAPAWSPDGTQLAFEGSRGGSIDLYLLTVTGGGEQQLTNGGRNQSPSWSPDGASLVFQYRPNEDGSFDLYQIGVGGGPPEQLTSRGPDDTDPLWLANGQIAFVSRTQGHDEIFLLAPATGDSAPITNDPANDIEPG